MADGMLGDQLDETMDVRSPRRFAGRFSASQRASRGLPAAIHLSTLSRKSPCNSSLIRELNSLIRPC
jgi:hypothetical protein